MVTDVENSTELVRRFGEDFSALVDNVERLVRREAEANGGTVVDTLGDATFGVFPTAGDAVRAAVAVQRGLPRLAGAIGARLRIGIHSGGASDERRLAVQTAARICGVSNGAQILMSHTTRVLLVDEDDNRRGLVLRDLGEHRLRGFERPFRLVEAVPSEWGDRAPVPPRSPEKPEPFAGQGRELAEAVGRSPAKS